MVSLHPPLRPYSRGDVWALTAEQAAAFDRWSIEDIGVPQPVLMENAGRAVAAVVERTAPDGAVLAVAGGGNNGGDALVAARTLAAWGREVRVVLVSDRAFDDPLLHAWPLEVSKDRDLDRSEWAELLRRFPVVIDGILGTGVRGAPRERQAAAIERVNAGDAFVVAVDVPSGIDASSGAVPGEAVRASATVSFGAPKLGALLHPARALVGRHIVAEIGFPPPRDPSSWARVAAPAWVRCHLPARPTDTHKNAVGRVLVVGGQMGMAGAVILAARAAFRAGAGMVRVCSVPENREAIQSAVPEALFVDSSDGDALGAALESSDAVALGPGLGTADASAALARATLAGPPVPMVVDADGLNLAADGAFELMAASDSRPLLITPHPGEMARLLPSGPSPTEERLAAVSAAVDRFGCAVLLKGAPSLVAAPGEGAVIDTQSSSDLAVAGMGDVLSGVCAALAAQGLGPAETGAVGLYLCGRAARLAGRGTGLTPSDVVRWLPDARSEVGEPTTDLGLPFVLFDADPAR